MSEDEKSLDFTGIGKLAKAVPAASWNRIVKTVCDTFSQLISPITATTYGLGKLIEGKFELMVDAQKVLAADAVYSAKQKVEKSNKKPEGSPKASVLVRAIESASNETNENIREIWSNLIANEIVDNNVHPDFPRILERLSAMDAATLAEIGEKSKKDLVKRAVRAFVFHFNIAGLSLSAFVADKYNFSTLHLRKLDLIRSDAGQWFLTLIGEEFLKAVSDPTFEGEDAEQSD